VDYAVQHRDGQRGLTLVASGWGGAPEASVLVHGNRLSAQAAAHANGELVHRLGLWLMMP